VTCISLPSTQDYELSTSQIEDVVVALVFLRKALLSKGGSDSEEQDYQNQDPHREPPGSTVTCISLASAPKPRTQDYELSTFQERSAPFFTISAVVGAETQIRAKSEMT